MSSRLTKCEIFDNTKLRFIKKQEPSELLSILG